MNALTYTQPARWQIVILKVVGAVKQACSLCPPTHHFAQCVYQIAALYQGVAATGSSQSLVKREYSWPNEWGLVAVAIVWQRSLIAAVLHHTPQLPPTR